MKKFKKVKKIKKQISAFTLIEIVAALAVLALGILSIISLFPVGQQASDRSTKVARATLLGQKKLEELTRESRDTFEYDTGSNTTIGLKDTDSGPFTTNDALEDKLKTGVQTLGNDSLYEWEYRTTPPVTTPGVELVLVSLGIYWPAEAGIPGAAGRQRQQNVQFATYIADYS